MSVKGIMKQLNGYQNFDKSVKVNNTVQNTVGSSVDVPDKAISVELNGKNADSQPSMDNSAEYKTVKNAIDEINKKLKPTRTGCEFTYNETVKRVSIKVVNKETEEVIKEIPPEEALKAIEKVWEIAGLIVDEKR